MAASIWDPDVQAALDRAGLPAISFAGAAAGAAGAPFPSPGDWRDVWIYQIMVDRFANPAAPPRHSWDGEHVAFQGGTFEGIRQRLDYLAQLGVGALWLSPVQKNCQYLDGTYHGYGIQDFLAIEPRFASDPTAARLDPTLAERELRQLIDDAHARGIYVIFDIVLNHAGDVFAYVCDGDETCQRTNGAQAGWRDHPYTIRWRDEHGTPRSEWEEAPVNGSLSPDAAVWPTELRRNALFRRQGLGGEAGGDFASLKEMVTSFEEVLAARGRYRPVQDTLIRAHQYLIAKYDVDGFRIDTLKYIERDFATTFANAIREFALAIGKKDFFTFGEVYDNEEKIARFIGRQTSEGGELIGVDAALDFPLFYKLPGMAKGSVAPAEIAGVFGHRKRVQRDILSSHGEASKFFVTFLDNHDQFQRFRYEDPSDPQRYDDQVTLGLGCLFTLQGIPCLYYGTEQGLHGSGGSDQAVREALWGKPNAFDTGQRFYRATQELAALRASQPALRYGRQYFRPISGNGQEFGISPFAPGVLAYARILQDQEVLVVANTNTQQPWEGEVIVDFALNATVAQFEPAYSNRQLGALIPPPAVQEKARGSVTIHEVDGALTDGPVRVVRVQLQPMEIQILSNHVTSVVTEDGVSFGPAVEQSFVIPVSNLVDVRLDPLAQTARPDPTLLDIDDTGDVSFAVDGAGVSFTPGSDELQTHETPLQEVSWQAPTDAPLIELAPQGAYRIMIDVEQPSVVMARVDWYGSEQPVALVILAGERFVAAGEAMLTPPDHGTVLASGEIPERASVTVLTTNPTNQAVSIRPVAGAMPLTRSEE
jgi:glycosidase